MPLGGGFDRIQTLGGGNLGNGRSLVNGQIVNVGTPPSYTAENALPRAIEQQGGDYDEIMRGYRGILNSPDANSGDIMGRYRQLLQNMGNGPAQHNYAETPEFREAFNNAREMSRTGGLSDADQANLRARGVSPIRAVYQNAQRNMERQARLSGGRSANYNASASRMAREQSESMAGAMTNVNAGIAEMVQRGRLAAMPEMTRMGEGSSGRMNEVGMFNANARNQHGRTMADILGAMSQFNSQDANRRADALRGMTSLYGTTPGLVNTFGNQVAQNTQLAQNAARNSPIRRTGAGGGGVSIPGY